MNSKKKKSPHLLWTATVVILSLGLPLLVSIQAKESVNMTGKEEAVAGEMSNLAAGEKVLKEAAEEKQQENIPKCTMKDMQKCTNACVQKCETNMKDVSEAKEAIKAAIGAIDKGDTAAAKSELTKAEKLLATVHKSMKENIEKMPCVNDRCPISGKAIDMINRPKDCTRMYKGMKVGFCCPNCPHEWDKLTDAEKEAKLKEVMPDKN